MSAELVLTTSEIAELERLESVVQVGLRSFYEVGDALTAIRDQRLYRATHGTFEEYCRERWGMSRPRAYELMNAAGVYENLSAMADILPTSERQARPLTSLPAADQITAWRQAIGAAGGTTPTGAQVQQVVDAMRAPILHTCPDCGTMYPGGVCPSCVVTDDIAAERWRRDSNTGTDTPRSAWESSQVAVAADVVRSKSAALAALTSSESNEWYTPARYVAAARSLMGDIDLDPASCEFANRTVKAARFYGIADDGLAQPWSGRVWLNPPYGKDEARNESNQAIWSARLIEQYAAGSVTEAVLLVNAVTDRRWFAPLWNYPICFTDHRIHFYDESGAGGSPTMGSALVYFGRQPRRFVELFTVFGVIATRMDC